MIWFRLWRPWLPSLATKSALDRWWYPQKASVSCKDILRTIRHATGRSGFSAAPRWMDTLEPVVQWAKALAQFAELLGLKRCALAAILATPMQTRAAAGANHRGRKLNASCCLFWQSRLRFSRCRFGMPMPGITTTAPKTWAPR